MSIIWNMNPAFTRQTWPTQWVHTIPSPFPCHQQTLCPARTSATVTAKVSLRSTMLMTVKSLRNLYVYWFYVYIYMSQYNIYYIYTHMDVSLLGAARLCKWTTPSYTTKHFTGFYAHLCGSHPPWDPPLGIPDVSLKCQSQGGKLSVPASGGKYPMKFIWLGKSSNYCWIFYG